MDHQHFDVIIVGAGIAGIGAGLVLNKANHSWAIF